MLQYSNHNSFQQVQAFVYLKVEETSASKNIQILGNGTTI